MMTAAKNINAKVLVIGAGVALILTINMQKEWVQSLFATDVRMASKEQVESLGGKFLSVEGC